MTKRRENIYGKKVLLIQNLTPLLFAPSYSSVNSSHQVAIRPGNEPLLSHFMLKPHSSSANPCNEEEVRYFMLPCYSLAESILPFGTKSEDLRHCEELSKEKKGPVWVSSKWTAWVHHYLDYQGNVESAFSCPYCLLSVWWKETKMGVIKRNIILYCEDWHDFFCFDQHST